MFTTALFYNNHKIKQSRKGNKPKFQKEEMNYDPAI
jgi:hypothetical protein